MKLIKLKLVNIKSYVKADIYFQDGINCILGLNGSGKSTIIESIGFALFNFSSRTSGKMLRYNTKQGSISLEFVGNDGIQYIIERTIRLKQGGTIKLIDHDKGNILYDTVSDVYAFIKKALEIPASKELPKLFEEIIAVPQGKYVNAFLETPSVRKDNFDRLFELHIYKTLDIKLRDLIRYIQDEKTTPLSQEIASQQGQLTGLESQKENLKIKNDELIKLRKQEIEANNLLQNIKQEKENLESKQKELIQYYQHLQQKDLTLRHIQEQLTQTKLNLEEAKEASQIVANSSFGYLRYEENAKMILKEQERYEIWNKKNQEMQKLSHYIDIINEQIKSKKDEKRKNNSDIAQAKEQNQENGQKIKELEKEIKQFIQDIEPIQKDMDSKEKEKKELNSQLDRVYQLVIQNDLLLNTNALLSDEELKSEVQHLEQMKEQQKEIEVAKKEVDNLNQRINQIQSSIERLEQNIQFIQNGKCPLLQEECHNVKEGNLTKELQKNIEELKEEKRTLESKKSSYISKVNLEQELQKDMFISQEKMNSNQAKREVLIKYEKEFVQEVTFLEFSNETFKEKINITKNWIQNVQDKISQLEESIQKMKKNRDEMNNRLITIRFQMNNYNEQIKQKNHDIEIKLQEIGTLELKIQELENEKNASITAQKALEIELKELGDAKKNIDDLTQSNKQLEEQHKNYLENKQTAQKKESLEQTIHSLEGNEISLKQELEILKTNINELSKDYSEETMKRTEEIYAKQVGNVSSIRSNIENCEKHKESLENEIHKLLEIEMKLKKNQSLFEQYTSRIQFISKLRNLMTLLPQELSKQYREYISTYGSILYHKISNENVRIEMSEDYEITLIDDSNEKQAKTMDQLSGGEQMSIAIAIRLSMLKQLTGLDIYFLDEPTINLDVERRKRIEEVIREVSIQLKQLFVISHDDTFDHITDSVIHITKENLESKMMES